VASCCECGDEPSGSCATELVLPLTRLVLIVYLESSLFNHLLIEQLYYRMTVNVQLEAMRKEGVVAYFIGII
jgi:hypothetical protein